MESGDACRTRIDVKHIQRFIILHLQDVRVSANEKFRRTHQNAAPDGGVVIARIATDMLDEHLSAVDSETVDCG